MEEEEAEDEEASGALGSQGLNLWSVLRLWQPPLWIGFYSLLMVARLVPHQYGGHQSHDLRNFPMSPEVSTGRGPQIESGLAAAESKERRKVERRRHALGSGAVGDTQMLHKTGP